MNISTCSKCGKPAHASETNDLDECTSCTPIVETCARYYVAVRDARDVVRVATLHANTVSDLLGMYDERALHEEARALCDDAISIKSGERVRYGIIKADSAQLALDSLSRIVWVGDFWYSDSNS